MSGGVAWPVARGQAGQRGRQPFSERPETRLFGLGLKETAQAPMKVIW